MLNKNICNLNRSSSVSKEWSPLMVTVYVRNTNIAATEVLIKSGQMLM